MSLILKHFLPSYAWLRRGIGAVLAGLFVLGTGLSAQASGLEVRDIRIGIHDGVTRFVVDLSDKVEPRVFGLPDPFRVVIDLPEVNFSLPEERIGDGAGLIEKLRYGLFRPGTSRFVLDLKTPAKISKQFLLRPDGGKPWRLVLDIVPTSRSDFIAAMRPKTETAPRVASQPPPPPPLSRSRNEKPVVVVDAGHGGVDPGAIGVSGVYEKKIALDYSHEVARRLRETGLYEVVMTRDRDIFLPLRERVRIARAAGADLFLSIHANTHPKRSTKGFSVYTLSNKASDKEAAALAALENKSDVIGGVDLGDYSDDVQNILIDFAQAKTNELSVRFARENLVGEIGQRARLLGRPWRSAGFAVLKAPDVPSVLLELGYISNPTEERLLVSRAHREKMSAAIVRAVGKYFEEAQNARL
jgi:N-acetylmuramoyl-L-alanine amidase